MSSTNDSSLRGWIGRLLWWASPLLLLAQYVGNFPKQPIWVSSAYLVVFLGALWFGGVRGTANAEGFEGTWPRVLGGLLVATGGAAMVVGVLRIAGVDVVQAWFQGGAWWENKPGRILIPTLAAWPIALGIPLAGGRSVDADDFVRLGALVSLPLLALLAAGVNYQGLAILPGSDLTTLILAGGAAAVLVAAVVAPEKRSTLLLGGLLLFGLLLRARGLWTWGIDPNIRDMLALVETAHESLLAGENPYRVYQMQKGSEVPLTYLPGLWLLYLGPELLGLDIRWMGVLGDAAVVMSLWWVASAAGPDDGEGLSWSRAGALALGAVWLFLPSVHWNGIYAEPHVWWGLLAVWLASVLRERWWLAAALTGLAVATRHYGTVVLPFVLIAMFRHLGWRRTVPRLALAGGVAAVLLVPFVVADGHSFWFGTFRWLREYGPVHQNWFHNKLGFAGPLYEAGHDDWLFPIQGAVVLVCAAAYAVWRRGEGASGRAFIGWAGTAYVLFVMFNGIIWYSFYLGAFLFVGLAIVHNVDADASGGRVGEVGPLRWKFGAAVLAVSVLAGGWIAYTLYRFHSRAGLERVTERLAAELDSDDLLIDRTRRTLEFVDDRGLAHLSTEATVAEDLFGERLLLRREPRDVWVAARTAWNRSYLERIAELGRVRTREVFGHYTLLDIRLPGVRRRLSRNLEGLEPTVRTGGGSSRPYSKKTKDGGPVWKAPGLPKWVEIKGRRCRLGSLHERLLYVHPHRTAEIHLTWPRTELGEALLLYGGVRNSAVRWNRGAVRVELRIDGESRRTLRVENRPGPWWVGLDTPEWSGREHRVTLAVTARDDRQRWTCVEAAVLGSPGANGD